MVAREQIFQFNKFNIHEIVLKFFNKSQILTFSHISHAIQIKNYYVFVYSI